MEKQTFSGQDVDEAIQNALYDLGVDREDVEISVVKRGKVGLFGLVGAEEAVVEVSLRTEDRESLRTEDREGLKTDQGGLEKEARRVLEGLLKEMQVPARVVLAPLPEGLGMSPHTVALDIQGRDLGLLIGRQGQTLASLQFLLNLMVARRAKSRLPIIVDVEGYKRRRYEALNALAFRFADEVRKTGQPATLEPMPAFERRLVHLALSSFPDIITESTGTGMSRKVVIRQLDEEEPKQ
ncbi:MAG: RNA-binding cell elongation regulator Jag/EloR [Dehalococcoidia bacterium]|nr:RNA-binding cell elongation regulator Jag/EloR [Dehalococcoidia bacterium]